ncbi:MAG: major capsid protein [Aeromicrobium sp.]
MTDSVVSRLGQVNAAGADDALFLTQFGGEILTEFNKSTVFKDNHFTRQIRGGKTAQFPMIGTVTSSYHTPGEFIDGQTVNHAQKLISIDGLLIAPLFIDRLDELENHYDVRGPYATEMGRELALQYDTNVARMAVLAARASSPLTGRSGGSQIDHANMATDSAVIATSLFSAAQTFDQKDVPAQDRKGYFRPLQYYLLAQNTTLINKDYSGMGSIASGRIETVAGIDLIKSNRVPSTNVTTGLTKYRGDFSKTVGVIMNRWAVGTVQLLDIALEKEWEIRRQGTFMIAKMAVGHDWLRPDCAIELKVT